MIDQELHVEDVIEIYDEKILLLKKEIDRLNEEVQAKEIYIKKLENELDKSIRSGN